MHQASSRRRGWDMSVDHVFVGYVLLFQTSQLSLHLCHKKHQLPSKFSLHLCHKKHQLATPV